jgi:hypothetical protein
VTKQQRTKAGPVTVRKSDGTEEERPAYSATELRAIIGHDRAEERQYGKRKPRQAPT